MKRRIGQLWMGVIAGTVRTARFIRDAWISEAVDDGIRPRHLLDEVQLVAGL